MVKKIAFIGAGRLAWHLSRALESAGARITEVFSRDIHNAEQLSRQLFRAKAVSVPNFSDSEADVFIIAVSDGAITDMVDMMILPNRPVAVWHVSGSTPMEVLERKQEGYSYGVFYPLQTFSKEKKVDFKKIPFCLEASSAEALEQMEELAFTLTKEVYHISTKERKSLHLAAVFACNFANHMMAMAEEYLDQKGLSFNMLKPLIKETLEKSMSLGPIAAQTGPAIRQDNKVMQEQINALEKNRFASQDVYELVSKSIIDLHHSNES